MSIKTKNLIFQETSENLKNYNVLLFRFDEIPNQILKAKFKEIKTLGHKVKHIKTSFLNYNKLDYKYANYAVLYKQGLDKILEILSSVVYSKKFKLGEISNLSYSIPKYVTTFRPSVNFPVLEKLTKVSVQKGYVSFDTPYELLVKGQKVSKNAKMIMEDFNMNLKQVKPLFVTAIVNGKEYDSLLSLLNLDYDKIYSELKEDAKLYLPLSEAFIENSLLEIYK